MTSAELKKLIKTGENSVVEFKRGRGGVPGDFWPSYSAFANTDGGVIVLGVKEENNVRVAKEVAIEGGTTDARNSRIFNIFALIDVGERSGMGLSNLYSTWAELGYDRPELEESHEPDQTILKVHLKTSTKSVKTSTKKTSSKSAKTSTKKTSTKSFGLPDEELVVLRLTSSRVVEAMRQNPKVTREELVEQLRVTLSGINWQIAKLQKDRMIRRVGGRKFGSWEVLI